MSGKTIYLSHSNVADATFSDTVRKELAKRDCKVVEYDKSKAHTYAPLSECDMLFIVPPVFASKQEGSRWIHKIGRGQFETIKTFISYGKTMDAVHVLIDIGGRHGTHYVPAGSMTQLGNQNWVSGYGELKSPMWKVSENLSTLIPPKPITFAADLIKAIEKNDAEKDAKTKEYKDVVVDDFEYLNRMSKELKKPLATSNLCDELAMPKTEKFSDKMERYRKFNNAVHDAQNVLGTVNEEVLKPWKVYFGKKYGIDGYADLKEEPKQVFKAIDPFVMNWVYVEPDKKPSLALIGSTLRRAG